MKMQPEFMKRNQITCMEKAIVRSMPDTVGLSTRAADQPGVHPAVRLAAGAPRCADVKLFAAPELDRNGLSEGPFERPTHSRAHVLSGLLSASPPSGAQEACCGMASSLGNVQKSAGFIPEVNHWLRF